MNRRGSRSCHARPTIRAARRLADGRTSHRRPCRPGPTSRSRQKTSLRERLVPASRPREHRPDPCPAADRGIALPAVRGVVPARRARHVHARWRRVILLLWQEDAIRGAVEPDRPGVGSVRNVASGRDDRRRSPSCRSPPRGPPWRRSTFDGRPPGTATPSSPRCRSRPPSPVSGRSALRVVEPADDWATATGGLLLQALVMAVPVIVLERVATAAEGPRRPLRMTYLAAVAYLAILQGSARSRRSPPPTIRTSGRNSPRT